MKGQKQVDIAAPKIDKDLTSGICFVCFSDTNKPVTEREKYGHSSVRF